MSSSISATCGTCFGFAVRSRLPFHYLRGGHGDPIDVSATSDEAWDVRGEPIVEWIPTPDLPFEGRLYRDDSRFSLWISGSGWFFVDPRAGTIVVPDERNVVRREERIWGVPAMLLMHARGDLPIHAAAVEVDGEAIVLAAPRTFGKTTLAAAFLRDGYRLLSEDVTCIRPGPVPAVVPGPAMLRVRRDVADSLELSQATAVAVPDDRVHLAVDVAERGDCVPVPIRAVVLLRPSSDGLRVETVAQSRAVQELWPLSSKLPTDADRARCFELLVDLTGSVPVRNVYRRLALEQLADTVSFVVDNA